MMKYLLNLTLLLTLLLPATATAYDIELGGIYYNITNDYEVSVTYKEIDPFFYGQYYIGVVTIPPTITYNGITYSVTSIGRRAFARCDGLMSVNIPNSVITIGSSAFAECIGLSNIALPNSVTTIGNLAFDGCISLSNVTIPNSVISIGTSVFWGCTSLTSIAIPSSVMSIGYSAFSECSELSEITVATDNPKYDSRDSCNAIIETATNTLLIGCKNSVVPNSVTSIGDHAFYYCYGLTTLTIPNSVTSVSDRAFVYCIDLASVTIPNTITDIGVWSFCGCSSLTSVTIPNSITYIGNGAFTGCSSMTNITVSSDNSIYDSRNNCNAIIETATNTLITGCKNSAIPKSVTTIGNYAFYDCSSLTSVFIPNSISAIGENSFSGCSSLTGITLPKSITSIGYRAFHECGIKDVYSYIIDPSAITMGSEVFYQSGVSYNDRTLHVPVGSLSAYQADTKWSRYFGFIVDDPLAGDVDADGKISVADAVALIDLLLRGEVSVANYPAADINGNGAINVGDVMDLIDQIIF